MPGRNAWLTGLCAGSGLRAKIFAESTAIAETFALVAGEGGVALLPDYLDGAPPPGAVYVRLKEKWATWTLYFLRQRGRGHRAALRPVSLISA